MKEEQESRTVSRFYLNVSPGYGAKSLQSAVKIHSTVTDERIYQLCYAALGIFHWILFDNYVGITKNVF